MFHLSNFPLTTHLIKNPRIPMSLESRIKIASRLVGESPHDFCKAALVARLESLESDYIIDPRTGEVIGDRLEIEELANECFGPEPEPRY